MPDRDIFNRNVERGWQAASRYLYLGNDDELTRMSLLRALTSMVKIGCPGIDEVSRIVADALSAANTLENRRSANAALNQVRRTCLSTRTVQAVDIGRRMLADPDAFLADPAPRRNGEQLMDAVCTSILAELAVMRVSPAGLLRILVENEGLSIHHILARRDDGRRLLAESAQVRALARLVQDHPDGHGIKAPRVAKPKRAQEEIVNMPIST